MAAMTALTFDDVWFCAAVSGTADIVRLDQATLIYEYAA